MTQAFWEEAIDPYTALHGVGGLMGGHVLSRMKMPQTQKIVVLALVVIFWEILEQQYFKELDNKLEWGINSATDILIGFLAGLSIISK